MDVHNVKALYVVHVRFWRGRQLLGHVLRDEPEAAAGKHSEH